MTSMPSIAELAAAVAELDQLDDLDRTIAARRLGQSLPTHLAAIADASVYALTRTDTQPAVAARLGVSLSAIVKAVGRHRATLAKP